MNTSMLPANREKHLGSPFRLSLMASALAAAISLPCAATPLALTIGQMERASVTTPNLSASALEEKARNKSGLTGAQRSEIVFVESDVANYQALIDGVDKGTEIHVLDASQDGLARMAQILKGRSWIDAIRIISHGAEAALHLGAMNLTAHNLPAHAAELTTIGSALKPGADILLYGCNVAAGSDGAAFVAALAQATHADIAASTDNTGSSARGGNWILERQTGSIESSTTLSTSEAYKGLLIFGAPTVVITTSDNALIIGETAPLTFTLSDASSNFTAADVSVAGGTLSNFAASSSTVYTATFTPTPNSTTPGTVNVAGGAFTNTTGDSNDAATQLNLSVDTIAPFVVITTNDNALTYGEVATLTFTLSEASVNFTAADVPVTGGTLSGFTALSGTVYTATFTPTPNSTTAATVNVAAGVFTDAAGNPNGAASELGLSVNSIPPPTTVITTNDNALTFGETATLTFTLSAASTNFTAGDITVTGGALCGFTASSDTVYTATFTPTANSTTPGTVNVAGGAFTNAANINNTAATQLNLSVDTIKPTVVITTNDSNLTQGETATLTFTLSEASANFGAGDISVTGGTLSGFAAISGTVYTATFTPAQQ